MRGVDAMVLAYLKAHPNSTSNDVVRGTDCSSITVRDALKRLRMEGKLTAEKSPRGHRPMLFSVRGGVDADERCYTDVCGKHYLLTGDQIQRLRDMAEGFEKEAEDDGEEEEV